MVVSHGDGQQPTLKASVKSKSMNCIIILIRTCCHLHLWICAAAIVGIGHYYMTRSRIALSIGGQYEAVLPCNTAFS